MFGMLKKFFGGDGSEARVIVAPISGRALAMSQVNDPAFSEGVLGKGAAIVPSEGRVVAPADGLVTMVFDTKHAVSIYTDSGAELIIHIGLDTVRLEGRFFELYVNAGDKVKKGDVLMDFDMGKIKEAGYDVTTPVIVCNTPQFPNIECMDGMDVVAGETPIIKL